MSLARTDDSVHRERAIRASDRLLASLRRHHGEGELHKAVPVPIAALPLPVEPPKPLAPIPNAVIAGKSWEEREKEQWFSIASEVGPPKIEDIIRAICKHFSVSKIDLLSARRTRSITRPRQVGYYLAKTLTKRSLPEIGRRFGNRDHTSALAGIRRIESLRKTDKQLDADVRELQSALGGSDE